MIRNQKPIDHRTSHLQPLKKLVRWTMSVPAPFRCDTACSSSLVAADAALSSLRRGTSEAAAWYRVNSVAVFVIE